MKTLLSSLLCISLFSTASAVVLRPGATEVVIAKDAPDLVRFAADEMTNYLAQTLGAPVPVRKESAGRGGRNAAPTSGGSVSIILGDTAWSRAAGIDVSKLSRDAYVVKSDGSTVFIVGRDDAKFSFRRFLARRGSYGEIRKDHERATLFGVYGFLEKYAGVRFILPDEALGTIVRRKPEIAVPDGTETVTPDYLIREPYFGGDGRWYVTDYAGCHPKALLWLRQRFATYSIPCCHGSSDLKYIERFGKTHPEYLALKKDGSRFLDTKIFSAYQYCWSNKGFREELYRDIRAYLTGQPPSARGLARWPSNCRYGEFVDIMPDDSFQGCYCADCQAAYTGDAASRAGTAYANNLIWGLCREIGERLRKEGVKGNITMMSYPPYNRIPDFDLPPNVHVMIAKPGPWSLPNEKQCAADLADLRAWAKKLGHKVWIWTYPHKHGDTMIRGVPCVAPHAWGRYYADRYDAIFGTFAECESDEAIFNFLNYYVFAHVMWDHATDIDALLDEAYALLFGAGNAEMKRFFELLEERWTKRVVGAIKDTPLGPKAVRPDNRMLWAEVYSPAFRAELDGLLAAAAAKVPAGSKEAKRVALMRREFYDRLLAAAAEYENQMRDVAALRYDISKGPLELSVLNAHRGKFSAKVRTTVTVKDLGDALEFAYDCVEPEMEKITAPYMKPGDPDNWQNNDVEVILNPSADGKTIYHVMLSHLNVPSVFRRVRGSGLPSETIALPGLVTETRVTSSGWQATIRIPKAGLPGLKDAFKAEFCRNRVRKVTPPEYIQWSPFARNFTDFERYGTLVLKP